MHMYRYFIKTDIRKPTTYFTVYCVVAVAKFTSSLIAQFHKYNYNLNICDTYIDAGEHAIFFITFFYPGRQIEHRELISI